MTDPVDDAQQAYATFLDAFRSVVLATVGAGGRPHASYAPFVRDERRHLYCLVSGMAEHKVEKGESLSRIARAYGVQEKAILKASGLGSARHVGVGRVLLVPTN